MDYYIFPKNMLMEEDDSQSVIQKVLPLNNSDKTITNSFHKIKLKIKN